MNIVEFNSRDVLNDRPYSAPILDGVKNLYEITENLEEYYRQKAPNLWNAWIRTNNMLVEQQEKMDKLENMIKQQQQYLSKLELRIDQQFGGIAKKIARVENQTSQNNDKTR